MLKRQVIEDALAKVRIVRINRDVSKAWNARRRNDELRTFCGWYWIYKREEGGPFPTYSACVRDAFIRFVQEREVPAVGHFALREEGNVVGFTAPTGRRKKA